MGANPSSSIGLSASRSSTFLDSPSPTGLARPGPKEKMIRALDFRSIAHRVIFGGCRRISPDPTVLWFRASPIQ